MLQFAQKDFKMSAQFTEGWNDYYRSGDYQNPYEPYSTSYEAYDEGFEAAREDDA